VRACKDREELAAKLEEETAERSKLGALVKKLQEEAEALQKQVDVQEDELQTLRRSTNYVVPNGRLKLAHLPSYSEVVWASKGTQQEHQTATPEECETAWRRRHGSMAVCGGTASGVPRQGRLLCVVPDDENGGRGSD
jgi:chromosome segregation ATPase